MITRRTLILTCAFVTYICLNTKTLLAEIAWPAESWSAATNLTSVEGAGANDFYNDLSGATWNPVTRRLWVCRNGPGGAASKFWALKEDGQGSFQVDTKNGNRGEWTGFGDLEGITMANYNESSVYLMIEGEESIKEYDVSVYGTAVLKNTWNTSSFLPLNGGSGAEGITFIPDSFLISEGFVDQNGNPYVSHNGMGGIMLVAHQNGGKIYAFDLNRTNGTFDFVGAYKTNNVESCELAFDRTDGRLYILHGASINTIEVTTLASTVVGGERKLYEQYTYGRPTGSDVNANIEGMAIVSNQDCSGNRRSLFLTIDDGAAGSLLWFKQFPCTCSGGDSDNDGVVDCNDTCPGTASGDTVDTNGCSCRQLNPTADEDKDGVLDCVDACPNTTENQDVNSDGCSCQQLNGNVDSDHDGVSDCDDACPNTPAGQDVNNSGCSCQQSNGNVDSDHDGVSNCLDACPNTPAGQTANASGCSCQQLNGNADSDHDGVSDCVDSCPNTPADQSVNNTGCSCQQINGNADSDNDGVTDCVDTCPATLVGQTVDEHGCSCQQKNPGDSDHDGVSDCDDLCPNTPVGTAVLPCGCPIVTTPTPETPADDGDATDGVTPENPGTSSNDEPANGVDNTTTEVTTSSGVAGVSQDNSSTDDQTRAVEEACGTGMPLPMAGAMVALGLMPLYSVRHKSPRSKHRV